MKKTYFFRVSQKFCPRTGLGDVISVILLQKGMITHLLPNSICLPINLPAYTPIKKPKQTYDLGRVVSENTVLFDIRTYLILIPRASLNKFNLTKGSSNLTKRRQ